jgi:hypothetical protein
MYIEFDLPDVPPKPDMFAQYWLRSIFISSASTRYEINALASTYIRLVSAALVEYEEGSKRLRDFWATHTSFNLSAMHRSISHFESCIFNANRATNCFRRLRGDRLHDPIALALRQQKFSFSQDAIADRIREMRNEIHHLEDSVLDGQITQGQNFALRPDGPEVPHPTEENQTVKTIDRLVIGPHEILFRELVQWLKEMTDAVSKIAEVLPSSSPPPETPNAV